MKLGMFIPEFPTQTHVFFWREIEALRLLGVNVHVLSTKRPVDSCPHEFAAEAAAQTHYVFPPKNIWSFLFKLRITKLWEAFKYIFSLKGHTADRVKYFGFLLCAVDLVRFSSLHKLDHIHVHSCANAAHIVALTRILGGPQYSLHLHGDLPVYGDDHDKKCQRATFVAAAARPMEKQLIQSAGVSPDRVCTLWMGVDTASFPPRNRIKTDDIFHLVSISRLHINKGHAYALKAIRQLVDQGLNIRYTIAGSGPHEQEILAEITRLELTSYVKLVGSLPESEVRALLYTADAFVLSTIGIGEASPVAVMEAMAAGVPVISSIVGGTPDMITNNVDGILVERENVAELVTAIHLLQSTPKFHLQIATAARERACKQFDSTETSKRLLVKINEMSGALR